MRQHEIILVMMLILSSSPWLTAKTIYVDKDATGSGTGTSWANAFIAIQPAITNATSGDELWIAEGMYAGAVTCKSNVAVYGGFAGTESTLNQRDYTSHITIIGGGAPTITAAKFSTLSGLTITGGGVYCSRCHPLIEHCVFTNNFETNALDLETTGEWDGGTMNVTDCLFYNNVCRAINHNASTGYFTGPHPLDVERCKFISNDTGVSEDGGAIFSTKDTAALTVKNCLFVGNKALNYGGAIGQTYGGGVGTTGLVVNCTFYKNSAGTAGNAIAMGWVSSGGGDTAPCCVRYQNCIIWGTNLNQIYLFYYSEADRDHCCLQNGEGSIYIKNGEGISPDDGGNITADPQFVNPSGADGITGTLDDNLHVQASSPTIDAGTSQDAPNVDLDGITRPLDLGYDIGAYEYISPIPPGTTIWIW